MRIKVTNKGNRGDAKDFPIGIKSIKLIIELKTSIVIKKIIQYFTISIELYSLSETIVFKYKFIKSI